MKVPRLCSASELFVSCKSVKSSAVVIGYKISLWSSGTQTVDHVPLVVLGLLQEVLRVIMVHLQTLVMHLSWMFFWFKTRFTSDLDIPNLDKSKSILDSFLDLV